MTLEQLRDRYMTGTVLGTAEAREFQHYHCLREFFGSLGKPSTNNGVKHYGNHQRERMARQ